MACRTFRLSKGCDLVVHAQVEQARVLDGEDLDVRILLQGVDVLEGQAQGQVDVALLQQQLAVFRRGHDLDDDLGVLEEVRALPVVGIRLEARTPHPASTW